MKTKLKVANITEEAPLVGPQIRIAEVAKNLKSKGIETTVIFPKLDGEAFKAKLEENNIAYITESQPLAGFAGTKFIKNIKNTMVIGSEQIGRGEIIYITDDPYFRAFWKSGRVILGNIAFR